MERLWTQPIGTIATLANTVLLLGCAGYLFFNGAPNSTTGTVVPTTVVEEVEPVAEPPKQISRGPRKKIDGIEGLFFIMDPVKRAALDHQADPALFLLPDDELAKAIASNSLDSKRVLLFWKN